MVDHHHVLKSNYKKIIISIYSCNRFVLLVLDLSPSFKLNTAFFVLFNNFESLCSFRLVVDLSPSQSFLLCFPQHLDSLCSLLTSLCLNLSYFGLLLITLGPRLVLRVFIKVVSGIYLNTPTVLSSNRFL